MNIQKIFTTWFFIERASLGPMQFFFKNYFYLTGRMIDFQRLGHSPDEHKDQSWATLNPGPWNSIS